MFFGLRKAAFCCFELCSRQKNGELGGTAFCVEGAIRFPAGFSFEEDTESFPLRGLWKGGESFLFIGQAVFSDNGFCYR